MNEWILITTSPSSSSSSAESTTLTTILNKSEQFFYDIEAAIDDINGSVVNTTVNSSVKIQLRLYDILIPILGFFIISLNLIVVISSGLILKRGQQPRSTYLFLGNVALSDLGTGVAVLFGQFYPSKYRDETFCAIQIGMIVSTTITSVYSVGLIAIDRFLYIVYGLQYQRWIYPNRARLLIILTWVIGMVIGYLPLMGWRGDTDNGRICWFIVLAPPNLIMLTTVLGILPVFIVVILYSIILYHALKKVMQLKKATENQTGVQSNGLRLFRGGGVPSAANSTVSVLEDANQMSETEEPLTVRKRFLKFLRGKPKQPQEQIKQTTGKSPSKWKAIKVVMFTTGSFMFTWLPYFIAATIYVNCDPVTNEQMCNNLRIAIASPLAILGFMNSLLNPIIYAWWHNGFRESVKKIWFSMCRKNKDGNGNRGNSSSGVTSSTSAGRDISLRVVSSNTNPHNISDGDLTEGSDMESRAEHTGGRDFSTNPNPSYSDAELMEGSDTESRDNNLRARSMISAENVTEVNNRRAVSNEN